MSQFKQAKKLKKLIILAASLGSGYSAHAYLLQAEIGMAQSLSETARFLNFNNSNTLLNKNGYGNSFTWGLGIGNRISDNTDVVFWFHNRKNYNFNKYTVAVDGVTPSKDLYFHGDIKNTSLMFYVNYGLLRLGRSGLNLNLGYGWSKNTISNLNETLANNEVQAITASNAKNNRAYGIGASFNFRLQSLGVNLGYRYVHLGKFASSASRRDPSGNLIANSAAPINGKLKVKEAYLQLSYEFN